MIRILDRGGPTVVGLEVTGRIETEEMEEFSARLEQVFEEQGRLDFVIVVRDFTGYSVEAFLEDLKFGVRHWRDIRRLALVTDQGWLKVVAKVENAIFPGEIRVFEPGREATAFAWAGEGAA